MKEKQIKFNTSEISSLAYLCNGLAEYHCNIHYYLKELNVLLLDADQEAKIRFDNTYKDLAELFSLLQCEREAVQVIGKKFRDHTKRF